MRNRPTEHDIFRNLEKNVNMYNTVNKYPCITLDDVAGGEFSNSPQDYI
jgi:hypothetical protein